MRDLIRLATRKSPLALVQAERVKKLIEERLKNTKVKLVTASTSGDTVSTAKFKKSGGKGLFLKELEELIIEGKADMAVHSLKDVPAVIDGRFVLSTIDDRQEAADVMISKKYKNMADLPDGCVIGTSSPRRIAQLKNKNKNIKIKEIRGNIQTRIDQLSKKNLDAIILAAAGIERLSLQNTISEYLPKEEHVPAAGQGILCVQVLKNNKRMVRDLKMLATEDVEKCADEERDFVKQFDGDCFSPIAAHCYTENKKTILIGYISNNDGDKYIKSKIIEKSKEMRGIGKKLARVMMKQGAGKLLVKK